MANMVVVTDKAGRVLASYRADPVESNGTTIKGEIPPPEIQMPQHIYHRVEIADEFLPKSAQELHVELKRILDKGTA